MFLSVVVPVYRTRPWLPRLLDSFAAQTRTNFEVIAVDDGSPDGEGEMLRETAYPWLRVFSRPHAGLSAARNFGLSQCRGEIVAMVDSDDWVAEDFVETTLAPFRTHRCAWTVRPVTLAFEDRFAVTSTRYDGTMPEAAGWIDAGGVAERLAWWPSVWNKAFRREMIRANWFDEGLLFEDHAFNIRNYATEPRFFFHPRPAYFHRRERAGQITASAGIVNDQVFDCFDIWATTIRNLAPNEAPAYLGGLARRLFDERLARLAEADRPAFQARFRDWARRQNLGLSGVGAEAAQSMPAEPV
jgi:glycosyltransferase involved in cell wall biosynthesis